MVVAVAERMLEYTLDVVKLEPGDTKFLAKTALVENKSVLSRHRKWPRTREGKLRRRKVSFRK